MRFAIVESGGKQYRAVEGRTLEVDRLPVDAGKKFDFERVLLMSDGDDILVGTPTIGDILVKVTVVDHTKGPKIDRFKYRPKKRIRVRGGHRQQFTRLLVDFIGHPGEERKAEMVELKPSGGGRVRLVFYAPTRGLIGYQGELLTDTRGTAIMNRLFHAYAPHKGPIQGRRNGVLISNDKGDAVAYALWNLEDRGPMMIEPGWKVYNGMIVGEHTRGNDLIVNVLKGKKLTNIRTTSKDEAVRLTPPIRMTLEKALAYIEDDELVEVTPKSIRLRKKLLDENDRKKEGRKKEAETV